MADAILEIVYNVTSTTEPTQLFYHVPDTTYCTAATLGDGTVLPSYVLQRSGVTYDPASGYTFNETGLVSVFYHFTSADTMFTGTEYGYNMYSGMSNVVGVNIPEGVVTIKAFTFRGCTNLSAVTFPSTIHNIGESCFEGCSLHELVFPNTQGSGNFDIALGRRSFKDNPLISITSYNISPCTVTSTSFQNVETGGTLYHPENTDYSTMMSGKSDYYGSYYLCNYGWSAETFSTPIPGHLIATMQLYFSSTTNASVVLYANNNNLIHYYVKALDPGIVRVSGDHYTYQPETIGIKTLQIYTDYETSELMVPPGGFQFGNGTAGGENREIVNVVIENGPTYLPERVCGGLVNMSAVTLPDTLTTICGRSFYGASSLADIDLGTGLTTVGGAAFQNCSSLTGITLPNSVTSLEGAAFKNCDSLSSITLSQSLSAIPDNCFYDCDALNDVVVPDSVSTIGANAFFGCDVLSDITLNEGLLSIGNKCFYNCGAMSAITLPSTLLAVGPCGLTRTNITTIYAHMPAGDPLLKVISSDGGQSFQYMSCYNVPWSGTIYYQENSTRYAAGSTDRVDVLDNVPYTLGYYGWNGVVSGTPGPGPGPGPEPSGQTTPRIYFNGIVRFVVESGDTSRDATYVTEYCNLDHITWTKSVYDNVYFPISADVVGNVVRFSWPVNHYSDPRYAIINVTFHDTSGNTYPNNYIQIEQAAGDGNVPSGDTPDMLVVPSSSAVTSAAGVCYAEIVEQNCNFFTGSVEDFIGDIAATANIIEDSGRHFFRVAYAQNNLGITRSGTFYLDLADMDNNNYHKTFSITQAPSGSTPTPPTPPDPPIPSGSTVDSGGTGQTVTYSGCPLVFDHSASTGTWHVLPTVTTGGTSDNWWFNYNVPANDTTSARTITYYYLRYSGASCDELVDTVSYTISQAAGSGSTPMKNITLIPTALTVSSASTGTSVAIYPSGCVFSSFTITSHSGDGFVNNPTVTGGMMDFTFPANTGSLRTDTFTFQLFDTDGDSYNATVILTQAAKASGGNEPEPWSKPGDSGYTWYQDDNLLRILPATKTLSYDEVTGYWPVTAHSFNNVEVRASGDVVFTYELIPESDQSYNSHKFYAHTEDNLGVAQQVSTIKLVAYSGTSAYSASTVLMKNPASSGWITASPNPVNANSQESQVNVYLTLTSCQRNINKEITDNPTFDAASWVTVTRVNNTTLTFNFQANTGNTQRSTYYYAYGLDAGGNNVYCRIDITQEANSMGITIVPDRTSLGKEAGSFTARVESTESGNFSFTTSPWMSVTSYVPSTSKSGTLYIDYSENLSNWPRTGVITATQQLSASPYTLSASTQISQSNTADTGYIRITPPTISVSRAAGVVEAEVSYGGLATYPQIVDDGGNMSIVSYDLDSNLITVSYGANDTSLAKSRTFVVTGLSTNGNVISATFVINQGGTGLPVAPIWRDYVLDLPVPGQGYINYSIDHDGTVVYTGRAYGMGQDNIHLFYNHLCKSFLSNHIDFTEGYQTIREWLGNFTITSPELGNITSVSFFEDYSYENRSMANTMSLNNPITNEVVAGGLVPFSFFVTGASGNVSIYRGSSQITGLTISDNEQHRYFVEAEEGSTYTALGARYKTVSACEARYSLYYVNSYGGVDVIPFKGKSFKKTDTITRLNYSRSFRNNTLEFENVNYMNEIKPAWELNTHYLVDSQSSKMHELVESTCVYLYDAEEQTYTPVVMTDKKLEYKTFYNQGRKFYTYTINVEESQSKERR